MREVFGWVYALAALGPLLVQLALVAGAPWGRLTLGGRWPGRLPLPIRIVCAVQAALLLAMIATVLDRSGVVVLGWPGWAIWVVLAISTLSMIANLATPSKIERQLWGPATVIMALSCAVVAFL